MGTFSEAEAAALVAGLLRSLDATTNLRVASRPALGPRRRGDAMRLLRGAGRGEVGSMILRGGDALDEVATRRLVRAELAH